MHGENNGNTIDVISDDMIRLGSTQEVEHIHEVQLENLFADAYVNHTERHK